MWDINKAITLIKVRKHKKVTLVNVDEVYSSINWNPLTGISINADYATFTNLKKPLIFGLFNYNNQWHTVLIDGHHRLHKAYHTNIESLPAYILTRKENTLCLIKRKLKRLVKSRRP